MVQLTCQCRANGKPVKAFADCLQADTPLHIDAPSVRTMVHLSTMKLEMIVHWHTENQAGLTMADKNLKGQQLQSMPKCRILRQAPIATLLASTYDCDGANAPGSMLPARTLLLAKDSNQGTMHSTPAFVE